MNIEALLSEADRCVKCGLCLPGCPTYRHTRNEAESPRGRIALIQGLAAGRLQGSARLFGHLNRCLGCGACEAGCPSAVSYLRLVDGALGTKSPESTPSGRRFRLWRIALLSSPRFLGALLQIFRPGLLRLLARLSPSPSLRRLGRLVPDPAGCWGRWRALYPAEGECGDKVALFTGCVSRVADRSTLLAAVKLLNRLGREVMVPKGQVCCGALHRRAGESDRARRLLDINREAFEGATTLLAVASGCGAQLADRLPETTGGNTLLVSDISRYLAALPWPDDLHLKPLTKKVAVHDPCTLRNGLKGEDAPYRLLGRIPGIEISPLAQNALCCGGAGSYMLEQPEMAEALLAPKLEALKSNPPDILVTSNTGCALHLKAGIREAGLGIEVLHPVELLARQLM